MIPPKRRAFNPRNKTNGLIIEFPNPDMDLLD
jgi:hypothetical protein